MNLVERPNLNERDVHLKMEFMDWDSFDSRHLEQRLGIYWTEDGPKYVYYSFGFQLIEIEIIPDKLYEQKFRVTHKTRIASDTEG